jgi:hypothetical protein
LASISETSTLEMSLLRRRVRSRAWLLADPRDVVAVGVARAGGPAPGAAAGIEAGLSRLSARIQRARLPVLLRRHATVALALAALLEALALAGVLPQLAVVIAPLVLFAVTVGWALRHRLSPAATAQFLDERLLLFDRLGTGLELERRGVGDDSGGELERRTLAEATRLVEDGIRDWRPRAAAAPREWAAAGAALAVLAALVVLAVVPGSGSGGAAGATARGGGGGAAGKHHALNKKGLEQYLGAKSGPAQIKPGEATPGEIRPAEPQSGKADAGKNSQGGTYVTPSEGAPTAAQQGFHFSDESLDEGRAGVHASGKSQVGGPSEGKAGGPSEGKAGGGKSAGGGGKGPADAAGSKQGTSGHDASQATGGSQSGANPGTQTPARAPASKAATNVKSGSSQQSPETGTPGGNTAGNGAGGNKQGRSREVEGTQSKGLKLQAGYAPYKSPQGGLSKGGTGNRQGGGGKARTGQTEGATKGNGTFSFVPATGGAVANGGEGGLAQSYSAALGFLERLPW